MQSQTHLFLVHDNLIPLITPALDPTFRPKEVILLCCPNAQDQAERLELILKEEGINSSRWPIGDSWDIEHIKVRIQDFLNSHEDIDIILNVTGGTQPMSLAAYEIFKIMGKPIYCVQSERDYIVWLSPIDREPFDLADKVSLNQFLRARDIQITDAKTDAIPPDRQSLTEALLDKIDQYSDPLATLNWLAYECRKKATLMTSAINESSLQNNHFLELINLLEGFNLIKRISRDTLQFTNQEALEYINGGWLEDHVYGVLYNTRIRNDISTIQDLARNIKVTWGSKRRLIVNEFDIAFLADNRLYIIECKTVKYGSANPDAAAQAIYKLDALRDNMGGVETRALFVSYNNLDQFARDRANGLGIAICCHKEIRYIEDLFRSWTDKES